VVKVASRKITLYVEGGGSGSHSGSLQAALRQGFSDFFGKTALGKHRRPRVVACGGREQAFDRFKTALAQGENALLLVDSEDPVAQAAIPGADMAAWLPWAHLKQQAGWSKPDHAHEHDAHLMVQCMESWLLCDVHALQDFYGKAFKDAELKPASEMLAKRELFGCLEKATENTQKGRYNRGSHSFRLLALIDPAKVQQQLPWARRLLDELGGRKP
jgi:hypothetical protein